MQEGLVVPADEFEPDNELEQANWLYNDEVEVHTLDHAEDRDWFLLSAGPGTAYLLSTYAVDGLWMLTANAYLRLEDHQMYTDLARGS